MQENFNSIDKLIEFGMSAAIATQMIQTMNQSISNMRLPGEMPPGGFVSPEYYVVVNNNQSGPFDEKEMSDLIAKGVLGCDTLVWRRGMTGWMRACDVPQVNKLLLLGGCVC